MAMSSYAPSNTIIIMSTTLPHFPELARMLLLVFLFFSGVDIHADKHCTRLLSATAYHRSRRDEHGGCPEAGQELGVVPVSESL